MAQVYPALAVKGNPADRGQIGRFRRLLIQDMQLMLMPQTVFNRLEACSSGLGITFARNDLQPSFNIGASARFNMLHHRRIQVEQSELLILIAEQGEDDQVGQQADGTFEFLRGDG
ncbi:hypothetical protein D3C81_1740530 [compost metagenome]